MDRALLKVENLQTSFKGESGDSVAILNGVSFEASHGRTTGIVGESGSGKSVTSFSILGLLPRPTGEVTGGKILFEGQDLLSTPLDQLYQVRGRKIAMIFQEPMTALNPVHTVGQQLAECFHLHFPQMTGDEVADESLKLLEKVGIPAPKRRLKEFPHQLSGGMRQRVMIALALSCRPKLLIADEPTTALDVTIQAQILKLMKDLQKETGMGILFITHDLGVIAHMCDDVVVMYAGEIVEKAPVKKLFSSPYHPYTKGLLASIPRLDTPSKSRLPVIEGMVPDFLSLPAGCRFQNRCPFVQEKCRLQPIPLEVVAPEREVACIRWKEI